MQSKQIYLYLLVAVFNIRFIAVNKTRKVIEGCGMQRTHGIKFTEVDSICKCITSGNTYYLEKCVPPISRSRIQFLAPKCKGQGIP